MENKINFHKQLEKQINGWSESGWVPTLLLHSCCAPCSSYCLEYLSRYLNITVFYYNPNITDKSEYELRVREQERLINELPALHPVRFIEGRYEPQCFFEIAKGLEKAPEGGERCFKCYELRLRESAILAKQMGFDFFTTTLSISPLKNAAVLNEIGKRLSEEYGVGYLFSDFKKNNGYKRSIELSAEYGLYRQNYCGCAFSRNNSEKK